MVKLLLFLALLYFLYRSWNRLRRVHAQRPPKERRHRFDTSKIEDAEFREVDGEGRGET